MDRFKLWLAQIIQERSVDLYRYKGVLAVKGRRGNFAGKILLYVLQGVHDMPEITAYGGWPEGKPIKTQVVIIGRKLDPAQYREDFKKCNASASLEEASSSSPPFPLDR